MSIDDPEYDGDTFVRNGGNHLQDHAASQPKILLSINIPKLSTFPKDNFAHSLGDWVGARLDEGEVARTKIPAQDGNRTPALQHLIIHFNDSMEYI
jgi:hypothetical protein